MHLNEYQSDIEKLTIEIRSLVDNSKREIYKNVNNQILLTYWEIGNRILTKEKEKAFDNQSSRFLITELSKELTRQLGKGYNRSNLTYMRLFSLRFPDGVTLSHQLSWSHFVELLKIDDGRGIKACSLQLTSVCLILQAFTTNFNLHFKTISNTKSTEVEKKLFSE